MSDASDAVPDQTVDSVNLLEPKRFDSSTATGPMATSTPMRSAQMPSEMQLQSSEYTQSTYHDMDHLPDEDLLDQDSEMQNVMQGADSDIDRLSSEGGVKGPEQRRGEYFVVLTVPP